jgi:hypothetical protein
MGVRLYHASLLLPKQVREKCSYYAHADWSRRKNAEDWAKHCYLELRRPFRVHNVYQHISWLERYDGPLPSQLEALWQDAQSGQLAIDLRSTSDVDRLLSRISYRVIRTLLKYYAYVVGPYIIRLRDILRQFPPFRYLFRMRHFTNYLRLKSLASKLRQL